MDVRKATLDDSDDLLAWRNDPIARTMSKSRDIVDCTTHSAWLTHALGDPGTLILIGENAGNKVGVVRFELLEKSWNVSINIAPDHRGFGHGYELLLRALSILEDIHSPCDVVAEINQNNHRSLRIFERCNFQISGADGDFIHLRREEETLPIRLTPTPTRARMGANRI